MDQRAIGAEIARLRKAAGLTQAGLASLLGISDKAVSKWERGLSLPDAAFWSTLALIFDTDIESIICGRRQADDWVGVLVPDASLPLTTTVYNKPLLDYLLSQFLLVGIRDVIVIGDHPAVTAPGIRVEARPRLDRQFTKNAFIIYGNQFLYGADLTRHLRRAINTVDRVTLVGQIRRRGELPLCMDYWRNGQFGMDDPADQYYALPYAFVPAGMPVCCSIRDYRGFIVEPLGRGLIHFHAADHTEALLMAQFVKMMEEKTGERIGCLTEIAVRRGLAEKDETPDDDYIRVLFD